MGDFRKNILQKDCEQKNSLKEICAIQWVALYVRDSNARKSRVNKIEAIERLNITLTANANLGLVPSFPLTCRLLFIISTNNLVV